MNTFSDKVRITYHISGIISFVVFIYKIFEVVELYKKSLGK